MANAITPAMKAAITYAKNSKDVMSFLSIPELPQSSSPHRSSLSLAAYHPRRQREDTERYS
jgi:hypothetical protein